MRGLLKFKIYFLFWSCANSITEKLNALAFQLGILLRQRVNGHRNKFHKLVKTPNPSVSEITDENILGAHLYFDHGLRSVGAFNQHYVFDVLHQGAPGTLRKYEQSLINDLGTLYPLGLNQIKSIAGS